MRAGPDGRGDSGDNVVGVRPHGVVNQCDQVVNMTVRLNTLRAIRATAGHRLRALHEG